MFTVLSGHDLRYPNETPNFQWGGVQVFLSKLCTTLESEDYLIILYGDLFNCDQSAVLLQPSLLAEEQGSLCYLVYNKRTHGIQIGTDKLGFGALYYHHSSDGFVVACCLPHVKWRLKHAEPDWQAWQEILNTGDMVGNKTPIKAVKRLRCEESLWVQDSLLEVMEEWSIHGIEPLAFDDNFCQQNNQLLQAALTKSAAHAKPKIIPLSGGHDSRRLAITAKYLGFDFDTLTQSWVDKTGYDLDTALAKVVAQKLAVNHQVSEVCDAKQRICNELTKDYWTGFESEYHAWALPMIQSIQTPSIVFDGIVADVTVNAHYMRELQQQGIDPSCIQSLVSFICSKGHFKLPNNDSAKLKLRVQSELERYKTGTSPLNYYMLMNHTRRNIGAWINLFKQAGHSVFLPYTDFNFFLHSMAACSQHKPTPFLQKECMQLLNAAVASIPSTRDTTAEELITQFHPMALDCRVEYPSFVSIHPEVYRNLVFDWKDHLTFRLRACGIHIPAKAWKIKRLLRLSLFLNWLDTAEGDLPATSLEQPNFLQHFANKLKNGAQN